MTTDTSHPDYFHRVVDCQWACPAHTDVPEYIRLIAQGRFTDAYLLNRESNVFPGILGRVCDRPCEPACRRGRVEEKPVAICRLKRVAADHKDEFRDRLPAMASDYYDLLARYVDLHSTDENDHVEITRQRVTERCGIRDLHVTDLDVVRSHSRQRQQSDAQRLDAQAAGMASSVSPSQASAAARQRMGRSRLPPANRL